MPVRRAHRPLLCMVGLMAALVLVATVGMLVDDRRVLGESVWLKPWKFGLAFALYGLTLAWLLSRPHRGQRVTRWLGTVFAVTGVVDVGFIVLQAARGSFSHFNNADPDPVNQVGQIVFTSGVPGLFLANLVIAVIVVRQRLVDRPTTVAIRAGLLLAVLGMAQAYLMGFTGEQRVLDAYGRPVLLGAGHTVLDHNTDAARDGYTDAGRDGYIDAAHDADGMPLTHWSTTGGDLRIPHFVGLHAIQFLLIAVIALALLARRFRWLRPERTRAELITVLAGGCAAVFALVFWQAMRAQSLVHPDAATLGVAAGLLTTLAGLTVLVLLRGRDLNRRSGAASAAVRPRE
ncbi:hypothetical protein IT779_26745 [Nocardia sp. NEAU-351]|uniref:Uncharacterized protein n=2 Tax=Nocardia bovistercoris TaxID=2785916 RepID=A0A931IDW7_9NOCA|nr:hypothetical protein [Nocardia bovistercoris]MBH0779877.1 hypothetical protein [Nocardia bovistercoris]